MQKPAALPARCAPLANWAQAFAIARLCGESHCLVGHQAAAACYLMGW